MNTGLIIAGDSPYLSLEKMYSIVSLGDKHFEHLYGSHWFPLGCSKYMCWICSKYMFFPEVLSDTWNIPTVKACHSCSK